MSSSTIDRLGDPGATRAGGRDLALALAGLIGAGAVLRAFTTAGIAQVQDFLLVFGSLLIEAMPFVLLGALVSATIEVFVPPSAFEKIGRLPGPLQLPAAGFAGMAFPVCECGSVPVARRLVAKGLAPSAAVTFMLAAPIVNPVVLASTFIAYRGRPIQWTMVLGRAGLGLLAAMAVGWVISRQSSVDFLKERPGDADEHHHEDGSRTAAFFGHVSNDFLFMGKFLVMGAAVAASLQTFVPQSVVGSVAGTPVIDLLAMMLLAFLLSLCSESDAFVAASFVQFGVGAQLAFLVSGPMLDTKLAFLYTGTFSRGFFRTVLAVVAAVTLSGALWIEVFFG